MKALFALSLLLAGCTHRPMTPEDAATIDAINGVTSSMRASRPVYVAPPPPIRTQCRPSAFGGVNCTTY